MKITPVDIHHKNFKSQMFGLNKEEVQTFLQEVASTMETTILERNNLKENLREKELSLLEYKERDKILNQTIATASQMAEKLQEEAQKEAKNIIKEAELQAQAMMQETREQLKNMYKEIMDLKKLRMQFEINMKALALGHIEIIEKIQFGHEGPQVNNTASAAPAPQENHAAAEARA